MKKNISILSIISIISISLISSDHIDSSFIRGQSSDIADFYAFQGEDTRNLTFIANIQGILSPEDSEAANFDQNVVIQFNIDTNNDNIEDLVIQAVRRGNLMWFFGPEKPTNTGSEIQILQNSEVQDFVRITPYMENQITKNSERGLKYFAGVTDDPFFSDMSTFFAIKDGRKTNFNNPGNDTWSGQNVLSTVVEVPKSLLGDSETINAWVTTHRRQ